MNDNFISRVYKDEPIIISDKQVESYTPPKYRAMRKIAERKYARRESDDKIFYRQAKFMENFEDDFDYRGEFSYYFPTYQAMNNHQLRGYFSWRTKIRRGIIEKTSLSFVFVYIYELINRIGTDSPEEGFYALKNFWTAYNELDHRITRHIKLWIKDYVIYNNLDKSLLEDLFDADIDNATLTLLNYKSHGPDEVFYALNFLSSYDLGKSRFFKQYSGDVKNVTYAVFDALSDHYDKNGEETLCEKFFGKFYNCVYLMFSAAVFYDQIRHEDFVYKVSDLCKFTCKNGKWKCESFFRYGNKNRQIGALLKNIDFIMRQKYNYKSNLKEEKTTKTLTNIINKAIDEYHEKLREAARTQIEIDVSKLQNIRNTALETQDKLLVGEESEEAAAPEFSGEKAARENDTGPGGVEYQFLRCLLYGRAYDDLVRSKGTPLSVLVDAVNENFFDRFGDTVIIETENGPELIADYVEGLKEIIVE